MKKEKTIFIILEFGTAIRNVLRTDILKILKSQKDIKIVIFPPITDKDFKKEFESENVIVEHNPKHRDSLTKGIESVKKYVWARGTGVRTLQIKNLASPIVKKRYKIAGRLLNTFVRDHFKLLDMLNRMQIFFFRDKKAGYYFDKYKPDLVFYASMYGKDICLEIETKKRKVKSIYLVHSWDNLTVKGQFKVVPDKVIVWNEILKKEAMEFHNVPEHDIFVSGIPQFDIYFHRDRLITKEGFFKKYNFNPDKKLITYATSTADMPFSTDIVEILYEALKSNSFAHPSQLLVRLHQKDKIEKYKRFEGLEDISIQRPGRPADVGDCWNPTMEDMARLAETMWHSDVVINAASTIAIDAAAFDTPVVSLYFDGYNPKPYKVSCKRYYDFNHFSSVVRTGGTRIAASREELVGHINSYLLNPSLDAEGRDKIRTEQCWRLDGNSGKRIAEFILRNLGD